MTLASRTSAGEDDTSDDIPILRVRTLKETDYDVFILLHTFRGIDAAVFAEFVCYSLNFEEYKRIGNGELFRVASTFKPNSRCRIKKVHIVTPG